MLICVLLNFTYILHLSTYQISLLMMNTTYYNGPFFLSPMDDDMMFNHFAKEYGSNEWQYENKPYNKSKSLINWFNTHNTLNIDFNTMFTMWVCMYILHVFITIMLPEVLPTIGINRRYWKSIINASILYMCMNMFIFYVPFYVNSDSFTKIYLLIMNSTYMFMYHRIACQVYTNFEPIMILNMFYIGHISTIYFNLTYD